MSERRMEEQQVKMAIQGLSNAETAMLDGPCHGGHVVAEEEDLFERIGFVDYAEGRSHEDEVGAGVLAKNLSLALKSKSHVKRLMHLLFERAMLWELVEVSRNRLELVRVKGGSNV
jgi:hypothetical protein